MKSNIQKVKAIESQNKRKILSVNQNVDESSGIYFLTRADENGIQYAYIGQSTQSHAWYKAVLVEKILERDEYDGRYRRLIYYDGTKQRGYISEMYFQVEGSRSYQRAWRIR